MTEKAPGNITKNQPTPIGMTMLKTISNAAATIIATVALACCSSGKSGSPEPQGTGSGEITLSLVSASLAGADSRSLDYEGDRPLRSNESLSSVDRVNLALFEKIEGGWTPAVGCDVKIRAAVNLGAGGFKWTKNQSNSSVTDYSNSETVRIEMLKPLTIYRLNAYAIAATDHHNVGSYNFDGIDVTARVDLAHTPAALTPTAREDMIHVDESFAGYIEFATDAEGRIAKGQRLVMYRQVAGVLGYFVNIPAAINGVDVRYIRIHSAAYADSYTMPSYERRNSVATHAVVSETVVDGDNTGLTAIEIEIPEDADVGADGLYKIPACVGEVATVENSVLGGRFIVPFESQTGRCTFTLHLCDEHRASLRSWQCVVKDHAPEQTRYEYSVDRNHFYSFGLKPHASTTDGDQPIDLSEANDIEIYVEVEESYEEEHTITVH